ncbi:DUF805 domain-containing protein [Ghiorsea bivora]|uniref:DUF805 domain-containing protein n=1 Tax=Ghiorsea bivora TaxID=1485545 RepID=UPI00068B0F40|nr:DUF805 domain-containing protein [Ghiorsea bivora]
MQHFIRAFELYGVFTGRSTREEYWMFTLIYLLVYLVLSAIALMFESQVFQVMLTILSFAVIIPSLSITARRLHDVGRSGWWQLSPYIGMVFSLVGIFQESKVLMISGAIFMLTLFVILLVFLVKPSEEDNKYGKKTLNA